MKSQLSLRVFLLLQFGAVAALPVAIIAILVWQLVVPQMHTIVATHYQTLARAVAGQISSHMMRGQHQLVALAGYIQTMKSRPAAHLNALLDAQCGNGELFEAVYITANQTKTISNVGLARPNRFRRDDFLGMDLSGCGFSNAPPTPGKVSWSEIFSSTASRRPAVALNVSLEADRIIGEITLDQLSDFISQLPLRAGLYTMVLDRQGRIVTASKRFQKGKRLNLADLPPSDSVAETPSAAKVFQLGDTSYLGTMVNVDPLGWRVVVAQPVQHAFKPLHTTLVLIIGGLGVALMLALAAAWLQAGSLARLFRAYADQAQSIARGEYDLSWPRSRTIEFTRLVQSLQRMARMISERERALVASETQMRITLDSIGDGVIATDADGRVARMNPMAEKLTGWTAADAIHRNLEEVFRIVNAFTHRAVANPVEKVLAGGAVVGLANHTLLIARDGKEYQITDSGAPIRRDDGRIVGVVLAFRDVTEAYRRERLIRENERRLKAITANVPGVVFQFKSSRDHVYTDIFVSGRAMSIFGLKADPQTFLDDFYAHVPEEEQAPYLASIRNAVDRVVPWRYEGRFIKTGGETIWFSGRSITRRDGESTVFVAFVQDISDRKQAEDEARRLGAALLQAQKMEAIGTLAGGIAHDFNNILSAVIGYAELSLPEAVPGTVVHRHLERIRNAGLRARDLVQQILAFSRKGDHEPRPIQAAPLVKEALKMLRSSLPTTIEITQRIDADIEPVLADPTHIHQIVMNLCTNATQAMTMDGGRLHVAISQVFLSSRDIRLHPGLSPGNHLKLSVRDSGRGISPEILQKIYDPYFTTKAKGKGTGLGLSVVHGIVQRYGGAIDVYSEVERGTTFNVFIPTVKVRPGLDEKKSAPRLPGGSEHILLVDDEPALIDVGRQMLEKLGYRVSTASDGAAALELFRQAPHRIDLVVTDMTMPKLTGDKLAVELLKTRPDLPIILASGYSVHVSAEKALDMGIKAFIHKPIVEADLAGILRKVLDAAKTISSRKEFNDHVL